jgi:orotate phosphoribosyltransferase
MDLKFYRRSGALLVHGGNYRQPHFELTSGLHSNTYFNAGCVIDSELELISVSKKLIQTLKQSGLSVQKIDRVVGPQICNKAGIHSTALLEAVAKEIQNETRRACHWTAAVKIVENDILRFFPGKSSSPGKIHYYENCLILDDVFTSGKSIRLTAEMIERSRGRVMHQAAVILNRSKESHFVWRDDLSLHVNSLLQLAEGDIWPKDECPLCKKGSLALRPKYNKDELADWYSI